jgi:NADPH-dependent 2,4-dienoyl-CoA reductase/sulfur reductase-like enzyme
VTHHDVEHLIIGAGLAGAEAAAGIADVAPGASVVLLSADNDTPYDRPPLSKGLWTGAVPEPTRPALPAGATIVHGRSAVALDPAAHLVTDDAGESWHYRRLLLATGGEPRRLGEPAERIIHFRTLADYHRLREGTREGSRVVVVGGGFLGAELAAALTLTGRRVVLLMPEAGLGARVFPGDLSRQLAADFAERGVDVRAGTSVIGVRQVGDAAVVQTHGGEEITGEFAIVAIGIRPATDLAARAGLRVEDGIVVDRELRTSAPDVYAAGDVARYPDDALGSLQRVEHEDHARHSGRLAGRNLAGAGEPYLHRPMFYGDLFDAGYEAVGRADARLETVGDWADPLRRGVVYYLSDRAIRGVLLWNVWNRVDAARALLGTPVPAGGVGGLIGMEE